MGAISEHINSHEKKPKQQISVPKVLPNVARTGLRVLIKFYTSTVSIPISEILPTGSLYTQQGGTVTSKL